MDLQTRILTASEYDSFDAINYSTLSQMRKDPRNLTLTAEQKRLNFITNPAMKLGALVDCMCFTPEEVDKLYYFAVNEEPGDKMGELMVNYLASGGPTDTIDMDILSTSRDVTGFQSNWGMPAVLKNFTEKCQPYFSDLSAAGNRTIISPSLKNKADKTVTSLMTCPYFGLSEVFRGQTIREYAGRHFTFDGIESDWQIYYQMGMTFPLVLTNSKGAIEQVQCKGKTDIILVSEATKDVYIIDLKVTGNPPREFKNNWLSWNYHIQAAMYNEAVLAWMDLMGMKDYQIQFMFLVAHPEHQPIIWQMSEQLLTFGRNGGQIYSGTFIPGLFDLIDQYQWHMTTQVFDYTMDEFLLSNFLTLRII
jgi:hypothetical protein